MTWCPQNAPNSTDLHRFYISTNFLVVTPRTPKTSQTPPPRWAPSHFESFHGCWAYANKPANFSSHTVCGISTTIGYNYRLTVAMAKHISNLTGTDEESDRLWRIWPTFLHFILSTFHTRYGLFIHMRLITLSFWFVVLSRHPVLDSNGKKILQSGSWL